VRAELVRDYETELAKVAAAREGEARASELIDGFDKEHPEVMREIHDEAGRAKKAERGSSETTVSAEGHAETPTASAKGG